MRGTSSTGVTFRSEQNERMNGDRVGRALTPEPCSGISADREWRHRNVGQCHVCPPHPPVNRMSQRRRVNESPPNAACRSAGPEDGSILLVPATTTTSLSDRKPQPCHVARNGGGLTTAEAAPGGEGIRQTRAYARDRASGSTPAIRQPLDARSFVLPLRRRRPPSARARLPAGDQARRAGDVPICRIPNCSYSCCCWFHLLSCTRGRRTSNTHAHKAGAAAERRWLSGRKKRAAVQPSFSFVLGRDPGSESRRRRPLSSPNPGRIRVGVGRTAASPSCPGRGLHNPVATNPPLARPMSWTRRPPKRPDPRTGERRVVCAANLHICGCVLLLA
jgi:hypothetical protein